MGKISENNTRLHNVNCNGNSTFFITNTNTKDHISTKCSLSNLFVNTYIPQNHLKIISYTIYYVIKIKNKALTYIKIG